MEYGKQCRIRCGPHSSLEAACVAECRTQIVLVRHLPFKVVKGLGTIAELPREGLLGLLRLSFSLGVKSGRALSVGRRLPLTTEAPQPAPTFRPGHFS